MKPVALRAGLWRWTTPHPEWRPDAADGSLADWPREVGCVLYRSPDAAVFIDPLLPRDEREFWRWADERCERREVFVLTTVRFHRRSRDVFVERYGASTSRARGSLPRGVQGLQLRGAGETMFWLPAHRALVAGDRILGDADGGLRLCPESWLQYLPGTVTREDIREMLLPLLELPIELVLVSHGEPVLKGGHRLLTRALS